MVSIKRIFAIARLELQKKKHTYTFKSLFFMGVLLLIFFSITYLLFSQGFTQSNSFYSLYTNVPEAMQYLEDSRFTLDIASETRLINQNGRYTFLSSRSFQNLALQSAFLEQVQTQNRLLLQENPLVPTHLLLLNVTEVFREELLLQSPSFTSPLTTLQEPSSSAADLISEGMTSSTEEDSTTIIQDDVFNEQEESTFSDLPDSTSTSSDDFQEDVFNIEYDSSLLESDDTLLSYTTVVESEGLPEGLLSPYQINSFGFVRDLFIFLQILFVLNLVSGLFGTAIFQEKINQRSSLLFSADVRPFEFILGKLLPYFTITFLLLLFLLFLSSAKIIFHFPVYFILVVLILLFLSVSLLNGLLARNHKEYSFLSVFSIAGLSLYLLIPAFLSNISELSYASLLTPLTLYSQGIPVSTQLLFFVIPSYFIVTLILFYISSKSFDFERLYTFHSPFQKIVLLLHYAFSKYLFVFIFAFGSVAFAFLAQLVLIAFLLTTPIPFTIVFFLLFGAFFEEFFRNLLAYAHIKYNSPLLNKKVLFSAVTGFGFVLAEKGFLLISIAPYIQGFELLALSGTVVPFLLHASLTYLYITLAQRYEFLKKRYVVTSLLLGLLHAAINGVILWGTFIIANGI